MKDVMMKIFRKPNVCTRFLKDKAGTAAIEFAFVAPVMIITYFGLAEVSMLVATDRDISHATSVTADLSTQTTSMNGDDIEDIFNAAFAVMGLTYTQASDVTIDIVSFELDGGGAVTEVGYAKLGTGFPSHYTPPVGFSASLLNQTSGLLVTRIEYNYSSPSGLSTYVQTPTLSETFMLKPRKSASIPFSDGGGSTVTCTLTNVSGLPRASC